MEGLSEVDHHRSHSVEPKRFIRFSFIYILGTPAQSDNNYNYAVSDFILNHFLVTFLFFFYVF